MKRLLYAALSTAGLLTAGCSGNECYENHSALPLAAFFSAVSQRPVTLQQLEIYGVGAPGDSVLYTSQSLSEAYLPFRIWEDSTQYVFCYYGLLDNYDPEDPPLVVPSDTVTFRYNPKPWFVSPACGAMYFYEMKSVSHTSLLIDSVAFNELITNENIANMKVFFKEEVVVNIQ